MKMKHTLFAIALSGLFAALSGTAYAQGAGPMITSLTPESGPPASWVSINGYNFSTSCQVLYNGIPVAPSSIEPGRIVVQIPPNATNGFFVVQGPTGMSTSPRPFRIVAAGQAAPAQVGPAVALSPTGAFVAPMPPSIRGFLPRAGAEGDIVEIIGNGFEPTASRNDVNLAGSKVKVLSATPTRLRVKVPKGGTSGYFQIQAPGRGIGTSQALFNVKPSLSIKSFSPAKGAPGSSISLKGEGFMNAQLVAYVGTAKVAVHPLSNTDAQITVPPNATTGSIMIMAPGAGHVASKSTFNVLTPLIIREMVPTTGYPGSKIQLLGSGFEKRPDKNKVTLGNKPVKVIEAASTRLIVQIPSGASSGRIKVDIQGRGTAESYSQFLIGKAASVSSFTPTSGMPGTKVSITGQGLDNPMVTAFVGKTRVELTRTSSTTASFIVPDGVVAAPIVLNTPGIGRTQSSKMFSPAKALSVLSFDPPNGPVGSEVVVTGTGFDMSTGKTRITLGHHRLDVQPGSDSERLVVLIPTGAKSGPFIVNVFGKGKAQSPANFEVTKESVDMVFTTEDATTPAEDTPTDSADLGSESGLDSLLGIGSDDKSVQIDSVDPEEAAVGDLITISGSGFGDDDSVVKAWIGNTAARVDGVMPDFVIIEVPEGVKRGLVKVKIGSKLTATSKTMITVVE